MVPMAHKALRAMLDLLVLMALRDHKVTRDHRVHRVMLGLKARKETKVLLVQTALLEQLVQLVRMGLLVLKAHKEILAQWVLLDRRVQLAQLDHRETKA